jgi:hypothetical protein
MYAYRPQCALYDLNGNEKVDKHCNAVTYGDIYCVPLYRNMNVRVNAGIYQPCACYIAPYTCRYWYLTTLTKFSSEMFTTSVALQNSEAQRKRLDSRPSFLH